MRLIDADALLNEADGDVISVESIKNAPTVDAVVLPCPIGSDCWYVSSEDLEIYQEVGGVTGFAVYKDDIFMLDLSGEKERVHSQWGCLSKEEAEQFREKLIAERQQI